MVIWLVRSRWSSSQNMYPACIYLNINHWNDFTWQVWHLHKRPQEITASTKENNIVRTTRLFLWVWLDFYCQFICFLILLTKRGPNFRSESWPMTHDSWGTMKTTSHQVLLQVFLNSGRLVSHLSMIQVVSGNFPRISGHLLFRIWQRYSCPPPCTKEIVITL